MSQLPWHDALTTELAQLQAQQRYRRTMVREGAQGPRVVVEGKTLLSFCSNDYLGLAADPSIRAAFCQAVAEEGVGAGAAHLLGGHSQYHHQLALALAAFTGQQRVLLFSSGYQANLAVLAGLLTAGDSLIQDKLNHASLLDGGRLSGATMRRYPHLDMAALQRRLTAVDSHTRCMIATDGVFSMDGDTAPLAEMMSLAEQYRAAVLVDDAHGFGVIGHEGRGTVSFSQWTGTMPIQVGTFGKAFGTGGAFIAADEVVIETLIHSARPYIYTTAIPPAIAAATIQSLKIVRAAEPQRAHLQQLIMQFRAGAKALGLSVLPSITAIQPIVLGEVTKVMGCYQQLKAKGILVGAVRPPTVAKGKARLRVTLSAAHTEQDVATLLTALEETVCAILK